MTYGHIKAFILVSFNSLPTSEKICTEGLQGQHAFGGGRGGGAKSGVLDHSLPGSRNIASLIHPELWGSGLVHVHDETRGEKKNDYGLYNCSNIVYFTCADLGKVHVHEVKFYTEGLQGQHCLGGGGKSRVLAPALDILHHE